MDTINDITTDDDTHDISTATPAEARELLKHSGDASGFMPYREIRSYGWTVAWVSSVQVLLFLTLGAWWSVSWSWNGIISLGICAVLLSFFAVRSERNHRHILPRGSKHLERIVLGWRNVLLAIGCVLLGAAASSAGLPASFSSTGSRGLGWMALVAGIICAVGCACRLIFAVRLLASKRTA